MWYWLRTRPYSIFGILVLAVFSVPFCLRQDSEWQAVYVRAASLLWRGEDIYRLEDGYLYPPFMAWTALPFLVIPAPLLRIAWLAINGLALFVFFRCAWRGAGGGRLEGVTSSPGREHLAALAGGFGGIFYLQNCLAHQQTDIVIGAFLAAGCLLSLQGRAFSSSLTLGLAAACKCTGLLWLPYFLWRGRLVSAVCLLAVALGVNFLPDLVARSPSGQPWLMDYTSRFLKPLTHSDHYVGSWGSDLVYNQSLSGAGQRWFATTLAWGPTDCTLEPRPQPVDPLLLRGVVYGFQLLLLSAVLVICGRPFRGVGADPGDTLQGLECSIVLLLMLLLSPMSSKAHFGTVTVAGFCLARRAAITRSPLLWTFCLTSCVLAVLTNKDPLGERLYTVSLWCGLVTWQTFLLLVGCLVAVRQIRSEAARLPCPAPLVLAAPQDHAA
jgi:hypothetical protein